MFFQDNSTTILYGNCNEIRDNFFALKSPRDVARLLEVSYDRFVYHIYRLPEKSKYKEFEIPKKSGELRVISAPSTSLKIIQRKLSQVLYCVYDPKASVHGFVPSRGIVSNAKQHLKKRFVFNIDLKDFFYTIHFGRVRGIFASPPYNLSLEVATVLAKICCYSGRLPQGAPTSPIVSNMVCARLDSQLRLLARELKCTYTRYADDITFSTTLPTFPAEIAYEVFDDKSKIVLGEKLASIIQDNDFQVNESKIRLQHKKQHQEVTGLTVNEFPNLDRSFIREISSMLHAWGKFGLAAAEQRYIEKCCKELGKSEEEVPLFREVVRGKINFVGMVRGKDDKIYQKFSSWYRSLPS